MESMTRCSRRLKALRRQTRAQGNAVAALKDVFAEKAEHLHRHDQAQHLDALGERIALEVSDIQGMEIAASYGFTKGTLIGGLMTFTVSSLAAAAMRSREHPLSIGARLAQSAFARTAPFGEVRVAVGRRGIPDDVSVIPLSRWAREQGRLKSEIVALLEARGYRLVTPESFSAMLSESKEKVLKGTLALPAAASSLERRCESLSRNP